MNIEKPRRAEELKISPTRGKHLQTPLDPPRLNPPLSQTLENSHLSALFLRVLLEIFTKFHISSTI
jgi:hypothetical protein